MLSEEECLKLLDNLHTDNDEYIRSRVAESLINFPSDKAEKILIELLSDKDQLVRIEACDSLSISTSTAVIDLLMGKVTRDKSSLVRGYAVLSLGDIVIKTGYEKWRVIEFLIKNLASEKSSTPKIDYYRTLYMLGEKQYLDPAPLIGLWELVQLGKEFKGDE